MKNFFLILISIVFLFSNTLNAQVKSQVIKNLKIKGKVISKDEPQGVIGCTVLVKGTTNGVATNIDGEFEISINAGDIVQFSAVGYKSKEIKINTAKELKITLETDEVALKEIAVVGYGVQERRDLTGSVSSVSSREMGLKPVSFDNALAGKVSGLRINTSSGVPGAATSISIRGINALTEGANAPLIVIDGIPVIGVGGAANKNAFNNTSTPMISMGSGSVSGAVEQSNEFERNPLSMLNPDDIESIEVLKDAYSTAIYGSRGAAGVILITTKKGVKGKTSVSVNFSTSISNPVGEYDLMNGDEFIKFNKLNPYKLDKKFYSGTNTDWLDEVTRTALTNNYNLNISSGDDKSTYYLSLSGLNQQSIIKNNDYERYTLKLNTEKKINDKLKYGSYSNITYTHNSSLNSQTIYTNAILQAPNIPIKDDLGNYVYSLGYEGSEGDNSSKNPVAMMEQDENYMRDTKLNTMLFLEYKPISWLTLKSEAGVDFLFSRGYNRQAANPLVKGGSAVETNSQYQKLIINNTASMVKVFGEHSFNAVVGQSFESSKISRVNISGTNFNSDQIKSIHLASQRSVSSAITQDGALFSLFARVNYQYKKRYLAGVTYRIDASSQFNEENRYVGFPSFSTGWRFSEEDFIKDNFSFLNEGKLRASIGLNGIAGNNDYYGDQGSYMHNSQALNYAGINILTAKTPSNPFLEWQKSTSYDYGIDLGMFNNKVQLNIDYYYKESFKVFQSIPIPSYTGYASQKENFATTSNSGYEINLSTINIDGEFKWQTMFNIAANKSEVVKLNAKFSEAGLYYDEDSKIYMKEGQPINGVYLFDWKGVDKMTGNPLWGYNGTTSEVPPQKLANNKQYLKSYGTLDADFFGGLTNVFSYKNFELNVFLNFSYGNRMINGSKSMLYSYTDATQNNLSKDLFDYWKIPGHSSDIPKLENPSKDGTNDYFSGLGSDRFLEDASYIKLKSLSLAYNFKLENKKLLGFRNIQVFLEGKNLYTWTKYSGIDPEVSAYGSNSLMSGRDFLTMPQNRTYTFGVKLWL